MEVTVRIDSNSNYEYAKQHLTLIDDVIYVVESDIKGRLSLHLLNDGYIAYTYSKYSDNVPKLLELVKQHYSDIYTAIKICQATGKSIINVGNVKGLSITDW